MNNFTKIKERINYFAEKQGVTKEKFFKDTGITDLISAGVPLLSVRDQARHQSIKQTDEYTPRNMIKADAFVKNSGVKFRKS